MTAAAVAVAVVVAETEIAAVVCVLGKKGTRKGKSRKGRKRKSVAAGGTGGQKRRWRDP